MERKNNKHLAFYIIFPIVMILIIAIFIFYFDLANGRIIWMVLEGVVVAAFITTRIIFRDKKFWVRLLTWVGFLSLTIGVLVLNQPVTTQKSAVYYSNPKYISEPLELHNGKIKGIYNEDQTVQIYAGIPYAKAERWKEPKEYNWDGTIDGGYFGPRSMQASPDPVMDSLIQIYAQKGWHSDYKMHPYQNMSEDSLYLNIWKPNVVETNLPILVYIHGGSLTSGSSAFEDYNGESVAKLGVIMITVQYRLGVFGYFAHEGLKEESLLEEGHATTGNYGLLDQIFALKWIRNNADAFGGDINNITVAGESAGSSSVSALCTSDLAHGLFKRAIGESSSLVTKYAPHTFREEKEAYEVSANIMKEFKCSSIGELRKVPAHKLVKTKFTNSEMMIDGYALKKHPYQVYLDGENNEEALLNGYNVKEADAFIIPRFLLNPTNKKNIKERLCDYLGKNIGEKVYNLYQDKINEDAFSALNEIISVLWFIAPHHSWSNAAINNGVKVYRYQFTKENGYYGTYHSGEMVYAYGNLGKSDKQFAYNSDDYKLSDIMVRYWTNFAKNGNPNGEGLPTWNLYQSSTDNVQELGINVGPIEDKYLNMYPLVDEYNEEKISEI